jgi:predicted flap endonuclease-1-like 5' DNA nuclease
MEAKKQKISHYELLMRACDKTKIEYERTLTKEAATKHYCKTASPDLSKSEKKILSLEYKKAKLRRKAKKLSLEISELRLKAWAKTHDIEDKIYELSESPQIVDNQPIVSDNSDKKSNKKGKGKPPLAIVIVPSEIKKPSNSKPKYAEAEAPEPKKRGRVAKPKPVEAVEAEPKKQGKVAKPKPIETVKEVATEPKKSGKAAKPKAATDAQKPQDLTLLEGIGPKVMEILGNAGISTFAQLAATKEEDVRNILLENKFRFGNPATMIEQAQLAAAGKMTELEKLKTELKGGKRK